MTLKCSLKIFNADLQDFEKEGIVRREVFARYHAK
jgi:DNA-binding HxlR family transcriptional regulator